MNLPLSVCLSASLRTSLPAFLRTYLLSAPSSRAGASARTLKRIGRMESAPARQQLAAAARPSRPNQRRESSPARPQIAPRARAVAQSFGKRAQARATRSRRRDRRASLEPTQIEACRKLATERAVLTRATQEPHRH
eukprot:6173229-Pleurochrysis_carterae.AAC.3